MVDAHIGGEGLHRLDDLVPGDDDAGAVVFELMTQLARRVQRVVLDDDRAEPQHGVERDNVLRAVRQRDRDGITGFHSELAQPLGGPGDLVAELRVGRLAAEELQCHMIGVGRHRLGHQVEQRPGRVGERVGNAGGVGVEPGLRRVRCHPDSLGVSPSAPRSSRRSLTPRRR